MNSYQAQHISLGGAQINRYLQCYIFLLLITWTVMELYVLPYLDYLRPFFKLTIWILPVYAYIKAIENDDPILYLD